MQKNISKEKKTVIIFFPFKIKNIKKFYLYGDINNFNQFIKIFFATKILNKYNSIPYKEIFINLNLKNKYRNNSAWKKNWLFFEVRNNMVFLKEVKFDSEYRDASDYNFIWINYDLELFLTCELSHNKVYSRENYFSYLSNKVNENVNFKQKRTINCVEKTLYVFLNFVRTLILKLSLWSKKALPITKHFNIAICVDNYLNGFVWVVKNFEGKKKLDIKVYNFLFSLLFDMALGILFLIWLNSKVSLDSSATIFLLTAESVVDSIKSLINWLRGDPAGLKLNWAFNNILAKFFLFHIEIWWNFLVYLKPAVKIIFQVFLKLGLLGITFQASIAADLLVLVTFHIYFIHAYAAKLYNLQISSLISLWRLFLGRKKNPLREKVDSCTYSPEQLFVGTLAFTILLFLLPTTLLYYIVFTSIKLLILIIQGFLMLIQYYSQTLPVYSSLLWLLRSPKIFNSIEITPCHYITSSQFVIVNVKPVISSWWETVSYFTPDCAKQPPKFHWKSFLSSLMTGKHLNLLVH